MTLLKLFGVLSFEALEAICTAGPCYRCLFPQAPSPDNCSRCSEAGVLGPVPGVIGVLQAIEVIKIATGEGPDYDKSHALKHMLGPGEKEKQVHLETVVMDIRSFWPSC